MLQIFTFNVYRNSKIYFCYQLKNFRNPRNAVKLISKTYVSPHIKHFSKYEAAIYELCAAFESLYAWLKRAQCCFIWTKYLGITAKEPECYLSNLSVFLTKV